MKHEFVYAQLIERARNRDVPTCYTETHHVIPRAFGGTDESNEMFPGSQFNYWDIGLEKR
jgi:hypothetical protein